MTQFIQNIAVILLTLAINTLAFGNEPKGEIHSEHKGSLSPHVHGNAELHIVLDASQLSLALHSPAMNLLGFEHNANSPEQQAMVESTRINLKNTNALFLLNGGGCTLNQQSTDFSAILKTDVNVRADNKQGSHEDHDLDNDSHRDIEASYQYTCTKPDKLRSITVALHEVFTSIASLQIQWIVHSRQGAATLNHEHNEIHFR